MLKLPDGEFRIQFGEQLAGLDQATILKVIEDLSGGKDVALCCYEKPDEFCHRQMVAAWLGEYGIEVKELTF